MTRKPLRARLRSVPTPASARLGLVLAFGAAGCVTVEEPPYQTFDNKALSAGCAPSPDCPFDAKGPGAACLALVDYSDSRRAELRVAQLQVESPNSLKGAIMQDSIITEKVKPPMETQACRQNLGPGLFNILFEFDFDAKTLKTGVSTPEDTLLDGTCMADFSALTGDKKQTIAPLVTPLTFDEATGAFSARFPKHNDRGEAFTVDVPIYTEPRIDRYALLKIHELEIEGTLEHKSCVGAFEPERLQAPPKCVTYTDPTHHFGWRNGGSYKGYVLVEEAEGLDVETLNQTLCVLLAGGQGWDGPKRKTPEGVEIKQCVGSAAYIANGNKLPAGNWCSVSNSADAAACGGVLDAWQIKTRFAAQAVDITGTCDTQ